MISPGKTESLCVFSRFEWHVLLCTFHTLRIQSSSSRVYNCYLATLHRPLGRSAEDGCLGGREVTRLCQITSVDITKEGPLHVPSFPFSSPRRPAHLGHVTQIISRGSHPSKHVKGSQPHKKIRSLTTNSVLSCFKMTDCSCTSLVQKQMSNRKICGCLLLA